MIDIARCMWPLRVTVVVLMGVGASPSAPADKESPAEADRAMVYLESMQRAQHRRLGTAPARYDEAFIDSVLERQAKSSGQPTNPKLREELLRQLRAPLRSQYEDVFGYLLMSGLDRQIWQVLERSSVKLRDQPLFGTVPSRRVNARAFKVPGASKVVIVFEDQLFMFANLLAKAAALAMPATREAGGGTRYSIAEADIDRLIAADPSANQRFAELMVANVLRGRPSAAPQYFITPSQQALAEALRESMELFVMGHEYGHLVQKHLDRSRTLARSFDGSRGDELIHAWTDELEADAVGVQLSVAAMQRRGLDIALSYWGADLFMTAMEYVERSLAVLTTGREPTDKELEAAAGTHPPWALRREGLRRAALAFYGEQEGKKAVELGVLGESVLKRLWPQTKTRLEALHKEGARPDASWRE